MHMEHERSCLWVLEWNGDFFFWRNLMNLSPQAKEKQNKICVTHIQLLAYIEGPSFHQIAHFHTRKFDDCRKFDFFDCWTGWKSKSSKLKCHQQMKLSSSRGTVTECHCNHTIQYRNTAYRLPRVSASCSHECWNRNTAVNECVRERSFRHSFTEY